MVNDINLMIEEHSQLIIRITALNTYVYGEQSDNDDKVEFANKAIQLAAMKKYEEALRARLENQGIVYSDGEYFNKIADVKDVVNTPDEERNEMPTDNGRKEE